jgi:predicted aldo/keto reductase-like oxidoreductase
MQKKDQSAAGSSGQGKETPGSGARPLPLRPYKDGVEISVIGLGGVVLWGLEQEVANKVVADSFRAGVRYFDVAPSYGDAELKLGPALEPYRDRVFLACKTVKRDAKEAREELERSLQRLRTDHLDLYQFHGVGTMEEVEQILSPGGAAETFLKARDEGKARYLGFSSHNEQAAIALMDRFECDSVVFPINFICFGQGDLGPRVLKHAADKGVTRLAIKALALTRRAKGEPNAHPKCWYKPITDRELARQALRFTLSEDVTATVPPGDESLYQLALELAADFTPLSPDERSDLLAKSAGIEPIFRA